MTDTDKIQLFLNIQKGLETFGFMVQCQPGGFIVEQWGDPDHRCLALLPTIEELRAFALGIEKSGRMALRGALFEIINIRNGKHNDGAVGKVNDMWRVAENMIQSSSPCPKGRKDA